MFSKTLIASLLAPVLALALAPAAGAQLTLFSDGSYDGNRVVLDSDTNLDTVGFDNDAASLWNFTGQPVSLFRGRGYTGRCMTLEPGAMMEALVDGLVGADMASSVDVGYGCGDEFLLYPDANYRVDQNDPCHQWDCTTLGYEGWETYQDDTTRQDALALTSVGQGGHSSAVSLSDVGMNDEVSSIAVIYGGILSVYSDDGGQGRCQEISTDTPDLSNSYVGNDAISYAVEGLGCEQRLYAFSGPQWSGTVARPDGDMADATGVKSFRDALERPIAVYSGRGFTGSCSRVSNGLLLGGIHVGSLMVGNDCDGAPTAANLVTYSGARFTGERRLVGPDTADLRTIGFNDRINSLANSTPDTVAVFSAVNGAGACMELAPGAIIPDLSATAVGAMAISSTRKGACPPAPTLMLDEPSTTSTTINPSTAFQVTSDMPRMGTRDDRAWSVSNHSGGTISLYRDAGYKGACQNVPNGTETLLKGGVAGALAVSSISVSGPCPRRLQLFDGVNWTVAESDLPASNADLANSGWYGRVSAVNNNTGGPVALYSGAGYTGRCTTVAAGAAVADLRGSYVTNDQTRSVRIGAACPKAMIITTGRDYSGTILGTGADKPTLGSLAATARSLANNRSTNTAVYRGESYTGVCMNVPARSSMAHLYASPIQESTISSIDVDARCPQQVWLFGNRDFYGPAVAVSDQLSDIWTSAIHASAAAILNNTTHPVAVYTGRGYSGACRIVAAGEQVAYLGGTNDGSIRSVRPAQAC